MHTGESPTDSITIARLSPIIFTPAATQITDTAACSAKLSTVWATISSPTVFSVLSAPDFLGSFCLSAKAGACAWAG